MAKDDGRRGAGPGAHRPPDLTHARRARTIGVAMALGFLGWMAVQLLGASLGLPGGVVFLADAAAIVLFVWALAATVRLWQSGRDERK